MCKPTTDQENTTGTTEKERVYALHTGRLEATVVAGLTIISSLIYTIKLYKWSEQNIEVYANQTDIVEEQHRIRRLCHLVVSFSLIGNALAIISSAPVFYAVWPSVVAECRKRRYFVIPYILVHVFLFVTAINKLVLAYVFFGKEDRDLFSARGLDVVTDGLALFLMTAYFLNLQWKPKAMLQEIPSPKQLEGGDNDHKEKNTNAHKEGYSKLEEEPMFVDGTPIA